MCVCGNRRVSAVNNPAQTCPASSFSSDGVSNGGELLRALCARQWFIEQQYGSCDGVPGTRFAGLGGERQSGLTQPVGGLGQLGPLWKGGKYG